MLDILIVDDEPSIQLAVGDSLRAEGHQVTVVANGAQALERLARQAFDLIVCDIRLPKVDGMTVFRQVRAAWPGTDVILITAFGKVENAVEALREGAQDYLVKPFDVEELRLRVARLASHRELRRQLEAARRELGAFPVAGALIGRSPPMAKLLDRIDTLAPSDAPVLITGESGTGKELVARLLHARSQRAGRAFVAVNCAAFPEALLEAELFGHERGAFTGAVRRRQGRFELANGGTLFFDEIGEMSLAMQAKLLRALEGGRIEPLGAADSIEVDVRVLCATHRNLRERIAEGLFREDLFYRLNVLGLVLPPLRERPGDLPLLAEHFLRCFTPAGHEPPKLSPEAFAALSRHAFPGNVRELAHAIQHGVVLARGVGEIGLDHLPAEITQVTLSSIPGAPAPGQLRPLGEALREFERGYLLGALREAGGKRGRAAEILGISRKTLWEKMRGHGLADAEIDPREEDGP
ncbi:MAG: sigma-54-dependent transcriptional regulator [Myxococcales bacterium]